MGVGDCASPLYNVTLIIPAELTFDCVVHLIRPSIAEEIKVIKPWIVKYKGEEVMRQKRKGKLQLDYSFVFCF